MENELIKITTDEKGQQLVSAKELYLGLGLDKSHWSRWYPKNIQSNEFFEENKDWIGVRHYGEGNETMDFAISLEFAKHIAMMARTKKSHEYRNYFIECEHKLIDNQKLILANKEIQDLKGQLLESKQVISDFEESLGKANKTLEEAKQMYKPSHKRKLQYDRLIKSVTSNKEEYDQVKEWIYAILQVDKWEDCSIEQNEKILEIISTVSTMLNIKKFEQLRMF